MSWSVLETGHLAESHYVTTSSTKSSIMRWLKNAGFAEYETGADYFGKRGHPPWKVHGFDTVKDAQCCFEEDAKRVVEHLSLIKTAAVNNFDRGGQRLKELRKHVMKYFVRLRLNMVRSFTFQAELKGT
jgi:hypothetical protein